MMNKTFSEYFSKFAPDPEAFSVIRNIKEWALAIDKETNTLKIDLYFDRLCEDTALIALENGMYSTYTDFKFLIYPHYPKELFNRVTFETLLSSAEHAAILPPGFFSDCDVNFREDGIILSLPYPEGTIDALSSPLYCDCCNILSDVISSRFGINVPIEIRQSRDWEYRWQAMEAKIKRFISDSMPTYDMAPAYADDSASTAEVKKAKKYSSVFAACAAPFAPKAKAETIGTRENEIPGEKKRSKKAFSSSNMFGEGKEEDEPQEIEEDAQADEAETAAEAEEVRKDSGDSCGAFEYHGETKKYETEGDVVKAKYLKFDISSPEIIYGTAPIEYEFIEPISALTREAERCCFLGYVFKVERTENRRGDKDTLKIGVTDKEASIYCKITIPRSLKDGIAELGVGTAVAVSGMKKVEEFDDELYCNVTTMASIKLIHRKDNAEKKRVELHLHTNMSQLDATIVPADLVKTAKRFGHKAVAVTDHGNVQSFPEMMIAASKQGDIKVIYGIEAYYVDNTQSAVYGDKDQPLSGDFCVFDIETTGLSPINNQITEIGAVRISGGKVLDEFNIMVNPGVHIPEEITELTGISDDDVKDAPMISEALRQFLDYCGDRVLIAHNANFDIGFIRAACEKEGIKFTNTYLDTVSFSQYINKDIKNHKLDTLANHYKLGEFEHHRASADAKMLAFIFFEMVKQIAKEGVRDIKGLVTATGEKSDPTRLRTRHIVLLVKNLVGLKNLYRLISESYLDYFYKKPRIPRTALEANREGLIIGSACEQGELYRAILDGRSEDDIKRIAEFYDYFEIMPLSNNGFLVDEGQLSSYEELRNINRRICALGKEMGKPVCATCDAHFLNPEDEVYRKVILAGMKFRDSDRDCGLYYRTTDEMLEEFSYLGEELANEVVIENTNKIADMIEEIKPIPDGTYTPNMEGAEEDLQRICWERAASLYEKDGVIPEIVRDRLDRELTSIIKHGFAVLYMIAQKLVAYSEQQGYLVGSRGSVGSSFVATMAGISEVNPLPPHYACPNCRHTEFITDGSVGSGFDLDDKNCPECGAKMNCDGHDIPFETFLGFHGDKSPDIDLNFSGEVQGRVHKYTEELFGEGNVFKAGTIGTLASKTAFGYVKKYVESKNVDVSAAEIDRIVEGCVGIKRTTGQHPGGIIVVPKEYNIYDFSPVQHPADDPNSDIVTTHFQFSYLHDTILKLDELGHDIPTKYRWLEEYTGKKVLDVPMNDKKVYELFSSTEPLGIPKGAMAGMNLGTLGLPEMGTRFVIQVLEASNPKTFADLLQISGLTHGTDVWLGNAETLIANKTCTISEVVGTRDDIMLALIRWGLEKGDAFKIMEFVRKNKKGKELPADFVEKMRANSVPEWYIDSCRKIKYMFPKAHAAAYVMAAIRIAWYKIYYPVEFYGAFFTAAPGGFDAEIVGKGLSGVNEYIKMVDEKSKAKLAADRPTAKEKDLQGTLLIVREALMRGVVFMPVDLYRSDASKFLIEDGKIRMPFSAMQGLGEKAAENILKAREDGEFLSQEDLKSRAGISKSVIETLEKAGVLDDMTETNQLSFF